MTFFLDDFLFWGRGGGSGKCQSLLSHFIDLTTELGVPLAEEKTEGLATVLTSLGIGMVTNLGISNLPLGKLVDLLGLILSIFQRKKSNFAGIAASAALSVWQVWNGLAL